MKLKKKNLAFAVIFTLVILSIQVMVLTKSKADTAL